MQLKSDKPTLLYSTLLSLLYSTLLYSTLSTLLYSLSSLYSTLSTLLHSNLLYSLSSPLLSSTPLYLHRLHLRLVRRDQFRQIVTFRDELPRHHPRHHCEVFKGCFKGLRSFDWGGGLCVSASCGGGFLLDNCHDRIFAAIVIIATINVIIIIVVVVVVIIVIIVIIRFRLILQCIKELLLQHLYPALTLRIMLSQPYNIPIPLPQLRSKCCYIRYVRLKFQR